MDLRTGDDTFIVCYSPYFGACSVVIHKNLSPEIDLDNLLIGSSH